MNELETGTDVTDQQIIEAMQREIESLEDVNKALQMRPYSSELTKAADRIEELEAQLAAVREKVIDFQKGGWQSGHGREGTVLWICTELLGLFDNEN